MNDLGLILLGVAARSTAVAALGLAAASLLRRRGPAAEGLATATTLAVLVGVSALAPAPWPRWWPPAGPGWAHLEVVGRAIGSGGEPPGAGLAEGPGTLAVVPTRPPADAPEVGSGAWLADFGRELRRERTRPTGSDRAPAWRWPAWAACAFLAGLAVAMARLVLGLLAVRSLRARSRAVDDPELLALAGSLAAELGVSRAFEVRESAEVGTPATVGWRRPAVLLPPDWAGWDGPERRAVLAHELAHVLRGDYLAGLGAQLSLSLYFYHPLVHALANRMRLQQELAADAWGARVSGGRRPYLMALAGLALRRDPRPTAWPARPFLPTRGTFLRRIEMLRDARSLRHAPLPRRGKAATVAALVAAGLLVAGFRGPAAPLEILAQDAPASKPASPADPKASTPFDPSAVGSEVHLVIDLRPAEILKRPEWKKLAEKLAEQILPGRDAADPQGFNPGDIEQILVLGFDRREGGPPPRSSIPPNLAFVLRASRPFDWKPLVPKNAIEARDEETTYYRASRAAGATCFRMLDDRTLLIGSEGDAKLPPVGSGRPKGRHAWDDAWKKLADGPVRVAFDTPWLVRQVQPAPAPPGRPGGFSPVTTMFGPLLDKALAYAVTLDPADDLSLDALATCGTVEGADRVADTVRALLTLARNAVPDYRRMAEAAQREAAPPLVELTDAVETLLEKSRVERDGTVVRLRSKADSAAVSAAAKMLMPAVQASREAARRLRCVNNLKQIGLAIHNYHAINNRFPPAVLLGPDGKTPHSWRVALLPFLEGQDLYSQYKFDEPWDGPNNRKLIDKMPAVYRHPAGGDANSPGSSAYFVLSGPDTLFPVRKEGLGLAEMNDGTSRTIMAVEARREIPWTKPEDIPYDPKQPLPELGGFHPGGFNVAFASGAVRFISATIDEQVLRALFTPAGGEVIPPF